jgi:hypothetical protein
MTRAGDSSKRELDQEIMGAWREAAEELGIWVQIPFILVVEDSETERYEGHVIDFGGPNGTVFGTFDDEVSLQRRQDAGYYCSGLASSYRAYNRELFIATLDD